MRSARPSSHPSSPASYACGAGTITHAPTQPQMAAEKTRPLVKPEQHGYKVHPINENRWRRQWTTRCLPPSLVCARTSRRHTRPDGGFRSSAFLRLPKQFTSESADRFFRLTHGICIMTARFPNGRTASQDNKISGTDPAATALLRGHDSAPATSLSGAFKAALGTQAQPPRTKPHDQSGGTPPPILNTGSMKEPGNKHANRPAASVPRKGHI